MERKDPAAYVAEFVGTMFLVLAICGFLSVNTRPFAGLLVSGADLGILHGFLLVAIVYSIGSVSGALVNPALTIALAAARKITPRDAGIYIVCQLAGGLLGAFLAYEFFKGRGAAIDYGTPTISPKFLQGGSEGLGFLAEAVGTFALMWAVMGTAVNTKTPKGVAGLGIGLTLGFAVMVFGPATGGSFNPARWFGPALVSGNWTDAWLYILAPIVGAVLAALLYAWMLTDEGARSQSAQEGESVT